MSVAKLGRDYPFIILVLGVWLLASPTTLFVPVMAVTAANLVLLLAYTVRAAGLSVRATRQMQDVENRVLAPLKPTSPDRERRIEPFKVAETVKALIPAADDGAPLHPMT